MTSFQIEQEKRKAPFAHLVLENKEVLFGSFNDSKGITKESKKAKWISIKKKLEALNINLIPSDKDWTHLRDSVWRNMVDNLKKKVEKKKRTGEGKVELNAYEKLVLGK